MKPWDLDTGAAKLAEAIDALQIAWANAAEHWDDETSREFKERYLDPLQPKAGRTLDAIRRLAEVFARAEHECSDPR